MIIDLIRNRQCLNARGPDPPQTRSPVTAAGQLEPLDDEKMQVPADRGYRIVADTAKLPYRPFA